MTLDELEKLLRERDDVVIGSGVALQTAKEAELGLGVKFPQTLMEYLTRFGIVEIGHHELFGLGDGVPNNLDLVAMTHSERTEVGCPVRGDLVPLLNDGSGSLYCMGTRPGEAGTIYYWDHSAGSEQRPDESNGSFVEFVQELLEDLDDV